MVNTASTPQCGSQCRWSGQRRRRNGYRKDASRWSAKYPKADQPCNVLDLNAAHAYGSSVTSSATAALNESSAEVGVETFAAVPFPCCIEAKEIPLPEAEMTIKNECEVVVELPSEALQNSSTVDTGVKRRVHMDRAAPTVYEITPYAGIYGLHPREFVFDRHYCMVPANGFNEFAAGFGTEAADEEDDNESDFEDDVCRSEWCMEYWV